MIHEAIGRGAYVEWSVAKGSPPEPVSLCDFPLKTVCIEGGGAKLMGRMREGGAAFEILDADGSALKSPGLSIVTVNPRFLWPVYVKGDATTVSIVATKGG